MRLDVLLGHSFRTTVSADNELSWVTLMTVTASIGEMVKISGLIADPSAYVDSDFGNAVQDRLVEGSRGFAIQQNLVSWFCIMYTRCR